MTLKELRDTITTPSQPRDVYDVVWLFAQGAKFDYRFARANRVDSLISQAQAKVAQEGVSAVFERRITPFLFVEGSVGKLKLFYEVLKKLEIET